MQFGICTLMRNGWLFVSLLALVAFRGVASAAPSDQAPVDPEVEARAHFQQGRAYLDAKLYEQAIEEFKAAYKLRPLPELLFNEAQALRLEGHLDDARGLYQDYVAAVPEGDIANESRVHIAEITAEKRRTSETEKQKLEQQRRKSAELAEESYKNRLDDWNSRRSAAGVGAAFTIGGAILGGIGAIGLVEGSNDTQPISVIFAVIGGIALISGIPSIAYGASAGPAPTRNGSISVGPRLVAPHAPGLGFTVRW